MTAADAGTTVKCKFVNERKTMTLKLQKAWVNGHAGDTAQLAIDGINDGNATSTATSTLGTVIDSDPRRHGHGLRRRDGDAQRDSSIPGANYNSSLACGAHAVTYSAGARTGSIAIAPADAASTVTCTYTNTRKSATLTVEKTWNDPVGGPSVTLAASGGLSAGLTGTTTSTSPTNLVAPGAPTMTIFAGETINVSEAFADATTAGMFNTTLSCATPVDGRQRRLRLDRARQRSGQHDLHVRQRAQVDDARRCASRGPTATRATRSCSRSTAPARSPPRPRRCPMAATASASTPPRSPSTPVRTCC